MRIDGLSRFVLKQSLFVLSLSGTVFACALAGCGSGGTLAPLATPSTATLNFGSVLVGSQSPTQVVTLTNTGLSALSVGTVTLSGSDAAQFSLVNGCNVTVPPGASCSVTLGFSPTAVGPATANLVFTDDAPDGTQTVMLTGTGVAVPPTLTVTLAPGAMTFASTNIGSTSAAQTATLTNTGTGVVNISGVAITGTGASSFADTSTCSATLAPATACTISVTFSPTAFGALSASLSVSDNATGSPQTVLLNGTGLAVTSTATITPGSLLFPIGIVGKSTTQEAITLGNTGTTTVNVSSITITGTNAAEFSQVTSCGATLLPTQNCEIYVIFSPTMTGLATATLSVVDNAIGSPQTATLTGNGFADVTLTLTPGALTFASTNVGSTSAVQTATLTNLGPATLNITGLTLVGSGASSYAYTSTCGPTLAPTASCNLAVSFSPNAVGSLHANLDVIDDGGTQALILDGTGASATAAAATLMPGSMTFASTNVGSTSAGQTATLTNSGTVTLNIASITLTGAGASGFKETSTCGTTLAPNASCSITITFCPIIAGGQSAVLNVNDNAPGSPQMIALNGTGVGVPNATLTPGAMTFASTNVGSTSAAQTATLTNTGSATLNISSISVTGAGASSFADTSACGATLVQAASCKISVTFSPTAAGALSATLNVNDDSSGGSPQTVVLNGTGAGVPTATLLPGMLTFGSPVGTASSAQTATLTNTGTAALTISGSSITGSGASDFSQTNNCPASLAVNASCTFSVTFKPAAVASYTATLAVSDNAAGSPQTVILNGTGGGSPTVSLTPSTLAFGEVIKLTPSAALTLTLKNTGTGTLTLSPITFTGTNATSYSETDNCGTSVAVNASCTITVTSTPASIGYLTGSIVFTDNAANSPQSLPLTTSGVKNHFKGLVAMNNDKTINGDADNNFEELNAHPNIYVGAVIKLYWSELEPSEGVFTNAPIEAALANIATYNKKYPAGPFVTGKIRITASANVPTWLYADAGSVQSSDGEFADFWNAEYTKQWRALNAWIASIYDTDERLQEIAISSCASSTDEPFVLLHTSSDITAFLAAGYTDAQYHTCLNGAPQDYAAFHFTQIDYTFNGEQSIDSGKDVSDQAAAVTIMNNFRAALPVRSIVANHGLANTSTSGQTLIYPNFTALYNQAQTMPDPPVRNYGLEFQTDSPTDNWANADAECESYHCTEFEIWDTTAATYPNGGHGQGTITLQQLQSDEMIIPTD